MNAKAKELGMTNSSFKNVHGFDVEGHYNYTTPYDLALLCEALCENEALVNIFSQFKYTVTIYPNGNLDAPASQTYYNTNLMLNPNSYLYYPGYKGIKTGYTSLAGNCLAGYYEADGRRFIAITMNSDQSKRDEDMKKLLDYALKNFDTLNLREVFSSKQIIVDLENASLTDESNGQLELHLIHPDETKYITVPKSEGTKIRTFDEKTIMIRYPVLKAPQKTGDTVGTVEYIYNNEVIYSCTAVASRSVDAEIDSPMDLVSLGIKGKSRLSFAFLTSKYFLIPTSIIVALLLLIGGFLFLRRRQVMRIRSRQRNGIARRKRRRSSSLYR
jgi:D-alanyl-D-alanine carboxypeptidase